MRKNLKRFMTTAIILALLTGCAGSNASDAGKTGDAAQADAADNILTHDEAAENMEESGSEPLSGTDAAGSGQASSGEAGSRTDAAAGADAFAEVPADRAQRATAFWDAAFFCSARSSAAMTPVRKKRFAASRCWFGFFAGRGFATVFRIAAATDRWSDAVWPLVLPAVCCAEADCAAAAAGFEMPIVPAALVLPAALSADRGA